MLSLFELRLVQWRKLGCRHRQVDPRRWRFWPNTVPTGSWKARSSRYPLSAYIICQHYPSFASLLSPFFFSRHFLNLGPSPYVLLVDKTPATPVPVMIGPTAADENFTHVIACKASCATPGYFSNTQIPNHNYVDFSVSSSNPSLLFFLKEYRTPMTTSGVFVSLGNGYDPGARPSPHFRSQKLAAGVKTTLTRRYMLESAHNTHGMMRTLLNNSNWKYCRLNPPFSAGMNECDVRVIKTVRTKTKTWLKSNTDFMNLVAYLHEHRQTTVMLTTRTFRFARVVAGLGCS